MKDDELKRQVEIYEKSGLPFINNHIADTGCKFEIGKCQHESDGNYYYPWGGQGHIVSPKKLLSENQPPKLKCKKCGEIYK